MEQSRITFVRGRHGDLEARVHLTGVSEAVRRAKDTGGPAAVYGPHAIEEMHAYFRSIGQYPSHNFIAIGPKSLELVDIFYREYRGRVRQLRRILSFLSSFVLYRDEQFSHLIHDGTLLWPDAQLAEYLIGAYVNSRKNPTGASDEIGEFFIQLSSLSLPEPVILRKYHWGWNAEQCILAAMAIKQGVPLVVLTDETNIIHAVQEAVATRPVTIGEVFAEIERAFQINGDVVVRNYRLWHASRYSRKLGKAVTMDDVVHMGTIGDFVSFLIEAIDSDDQASDSALSIPTRIVAPLMFREGGDAIGLDHTSVTGLTYHNAIGGIRALKNLSEDVRDSGVLLNAISGISPCLNRIIKILERIQGEATIEESSVVEFGVEFSYLESRILNAQSKLSNETMEFMLSYTGQGQALLERFEPWQTYRAEGGGTYGGLGAVNREIADAAIRVLQSASKEGLLDRGAAGRVAEMIEAADVEAPLKRASLAATSHNLGAAVGRSALTRSRDFAKDVLKGAEADAKKKLSASAAAFIHRHAVDLAKLATTESGKWLAALLKTFGGDA